jgi:hypothetical protein
MTLQRDPKQSSIDSNTYADQPADAATNGDDNTDRRQFFARFAHLGVKFAAVASLLPTTQTRSEANPLNAATPLPPTETEQRAADVARLAANLAQSDPAVNYVSIYRYSRNDEPALKMVSPGVWREHFSDGRLGEIVEVEAADGEGECSCPVG